MTTYTNEKQYSFGEKGDTEVTISKEGLSMREIRNSEGVAKMWIAYGKCESEAAAWEQQQKAKVIETFVKSLTSRWEERVQAIKGMMEELQSEAIKTHKEGSATTLQVKTVWEGVPQAAGYVAASTTQAGDHRGMIETAATKGGYSYSVQWPDQVLNKMQNGWSNLWLRSNPKSQIEDLRREFDEQVGNLLEIEESLFQFINA